MDCTFISIHDLSLDARLLYVSTSIEDILGYKPHEVVGKSCWEYFHPDEIPFARSIHGRSIQLDKAAVLNYCQIKNRHGRWVGCECVFTIVHDVLVASTSVYRRGPSSQKRAIEAPVIRQLFSSSPRDPRYHMLSYISYKFSQEIPTHINEPRAALFLNRFSRTLAIMYATNGLADVLGIPCDQLIGKSFYFCIQENCLREAVKCLESAKANDSIAYLRFWFRDPTQDNRQNSDRQDEDDRMTDGNSSGDDDDGGVHLSELMDHDANENTIISDSSNSTRSSAKPHRSGNFDPNSRSSSGNSTDMEGSNPDPIFDRPAGNQSRTSSISTPDDAQSSNQPWSPEGTQIELEAVVSCTSDGLVVVLRRAKPFVPHMAATVDETTMHHYANGFFASPWANEPILPNFQNRANPLPDPIRPSQFPIHPTAARADAAAIKGPASEDFMNSIREVAVFAWSLTGINGSLEKYGRGTPSGESLPPGGLPIWDPSSTAGPEMHTSAENVRNGYNYSPINGVPIDRQIQNNGNLATNHQYDMNLDHPHTTPAPPNEIYDPPQRDGYKQETSMYHDPMQTDGYGNTSSIYGYGAQTLDFGDNDQRNGSNGFFDPTHNANDEQQSQSNAYHGAQNVEYDPYAPKQHQGSIAAHSQDQSNGFKTGTPSTEYDPYAPAASHVPASVNHTSFQEPHPKNRWDADNMGQVHDNEFGH